MPVMHTHISWTDATWNPVTGCTKVSPGCDNCYAEAITNRLRGGNFDKVTIHPERLQQTKLFRPRKDGDRRRPAKIFVNSMSDMFHDDIPADFRGRVFEVMETHREAVFQILSKRPAQMRQYVRARYPKGVPPHIWLGTSVEDNRVAGRLNILRKMRTDVGGGVLLFASVEPLIGPADAMDFTGFGWVLIGGESPQMGRWRPMKAQWAAQALRAARDAGAAVHFKQWGHPANNPLVQARLGPGVPARAVFAAMCREGLELAPEEKGGATLNGEVVREVPAVYGELTRRLNARLFDGKEKGR